MAAVFAATIRSALLVRADRLAYAQSVNAGFLCTGARAAASAAAVIAAHAGITIGYADACPGKALLLEPCAGSAVTAATIGAASLVQALGNAVGATAVFTTKGALRNGAVLHAATIEPAHVVSAAIAVVLGLAQTLIVHADLAIEATPAASAAAVSSTSFADALWLALAEAINTCVLCTAAIAATAAAAVVTALDAITSNRWVAAQSGEARSSDSTWGVVGKKTPCLLVYSGLALAAFVAWLFRPTGHANVVDEAEEILNLVVALSLVAGVDGATLAVVARAA